MPENTLLLSYFDNIVGPVVFLAEPATVNKKNFDNVSQLMGLYKTGFFMHEFGGLKSANLIFQIPSRYARGGQEMLMLSYLSTSDLDMRLVQEHMTDFCRQLERCKDSYKAFYINSTKYQGDPERFKKVEDLFKALYHSFPSEIVIFTPRQAKIFLFGLTQAGKTTLLHALQNRKITKENIPTVNIGVTKVFVDSVSIMVYDAPGQATYRDSWAPQLNGQDGLVFVVDITDKKRIGEAKGVLHDFAMRWETSHLPLAVLYNKVDIKTPKVENITKELEVARLQDKNRPVKYFLTSAITGEGVGTAFSWMAASVTKR